MYITRNNRSRHRFNSQFDSYPVQNHLYYDENDAIELTPEKKDPSIMSAAIPYLIIAVIFILLLLGILKLIQTKRQKKVSETSNFVASNSAVAAPTEDIQMTPVVPPYSEIKLDDYKFTR
ncbi:unnamed protein product [Candida verbasci]|uniref:Uncharacterized protein n=1 Tax=Candida verbasci TaxID=1227364 RepID=A0A9W4XEN8_9ASCO|nr:unnamed protein product [Candida verbasci]